MNLIHISYVPDNNFLTKINWKVVSSSFYFYNVQHANWHKNYDWFKLELRNTYSRKPIYIEIYSPSLFLCFHGNRNSNLFHIFIACDNNAVSEIFCISFKINNLQNLLQKLYNSNQTIIEITLLWDIVSQRMFNIIYSKPVNTTHAKNEGLFNECWCCDDIILIIKMVLHIHSYLSSLS